MDKGYMAVMARKNDIMKRAVGMDYARFESGGIAFDYEALMAAPGLSIGDAMAIQRDYAIGNTPLIELKNISALARDCAKTGLGARIFIKDEACNPSGSFKARRAALGVEAARRMGYKGVVTATSGNYGAAVASCAAKAGLKCIVVQECFDARGVGQPEIIEKARACEALGAEVLQLSVGPELFYVFLRVLEDTGFFNASLYTPHAILGVETLGYEIAAQCRAQLGRDPHRVVVTNAGGGNLTGTARGLHKAECYPHITAASVDLKGLHMASDTQFNRKSFTTGHTGFGMPYTTWPDRSDVPRSAARPLRYMDDYVTLTQGEVFYMTQALATLEGLERGPAGNTSLAAAFALAQEMPREHILVVQETEYTGAGKHHNAQLDFARHNGIRVSVGNPADEVPGQSIILPAGPEFIKARGVDMAALRKSYIRNAGNAHPGNPTQQDLLFLSQETRADSDFITAQLQEVG